MSGGSDRGSGSRLSSRLKIPIHLSESKRVIGATADVVTLFGLPRTTETARGPRTMEEQSAYEPVVAGTKDGRPLRYQHGASPQWALGS